MALSITGVPSYVAPTCTTPFVVTGAVGGYSVSLKAGEDGGEISGETYVAPESATLGYQTLEVIDSESNTASVKIKIYNHLQLLAKILQEFMGLSSDQIFLYNQKVVIPKDNRIYVAIKLNGYKSIGVSSKISEEGDTEKIYSVGLHTVSIDITSRGPEALQKKEDVILALSSTFAQNTQEANGFQISRIPTSFNDLSNLEGSLIPYRFNISINLTASKRRTISTNYYDTINANLYGSNGAIESIAGEAPEPVVAGDILLEDGIYYLLQESGYAISEE